ncbi:MAG: PAS domain S-box protein [Lutibacter sp.]
MRILLLEDNNTDIDLTKRSLINAYPDCSIAVAATLKEAKKLLENNNDFDIALLDMRLPDGNGLDFLMEIRKSDHNMAVVMLTGTGNEEVAVSALKSGANDYVVKHHDYLKNLPEVIDFAIINYRKNLQQKAKTLEVLYIEHNSADVDLTLRHLIQFAPYIHLEAVATASEALELLAKNNHEANKFDVLLMDYKLLKMNAFEVVKTIRQERQLTIPIILVTGQGTEEVAIQALKLGADEYLVKRENYLFRLPSLIISAHQKSLLIKQQLDLIQSEAKYRLLADNSGDVIFVLDLNLKCTYISPSVKTLRDFEPEEALKLKLEEALTPASNIKYRKIIAEIIDENKKNPKSPLNQKTVELEMFKKDKTTVWVEVKVTLILDENNAPIGILGVSRDITAGRIIRSQLRKLSRAVEQSPVSIIITDTNGAIDYVNPRFTKATGYTFEEVMGKNPNILKSEFTTYADYHNLWKTIATGNEWSGEFLNKRKDGSTYWESASISPIKNDDGEITHYLAIQENISEKKKKEAELISAKEKAEESDKLKTAFLHNITHEIRTPMNAIVGFSEFLTDPNLSQDKIHRYSGIINKSSHQLLSIITDIINIATIESGQAKITEKKFKLNSVLETIYDQFNVMAKTKQINLTLKLSLPDYDDIIFSDETKITQILTNLVGNALKFTNFGSVHFGYETKDTEIEFFVEDSGIGIPNEMHDEIFKRFSQVENSSELQAGGTGLGLAIAKSYVKLLGGNMWLRSQPDNGSKFYFTIPVVKD